MVDGVLTVFLSEENSACEEACVGSGTNKDGFKSSKNHPIVAVLDEMEKELEYREKIP
jgi:hypothetical protein